MDQPPAAPREKQPWPMKWIVLAIATYVAGYTFINISYRKPAGSANEPYAAARERSMRTIQTTLAGWSRVACTFAQDAAALAPAAPAAIAEQALPQPLHRHLPQDLPPIMPGEPALHPATLRLHAPDTMSAQAALPIGLEFSEGAVVAGFGETLAYFKDNHLYVFIQDPRHVLPGSSPTAPGQPLALVLPPATLTPGTWHASAFTAKQAFTWSFEVR